MFAVTAIARFIPPMDAFLHTTALSVSDRFRGTSRPTPTPAPPVPHLVQVVGLGDSVPAGTACDCSSYVALVAQELARRSGGPYRVENLALRGATSQYVVDQLASPGVRTAVATADVVIVTIGANDVDEGELFKPECAPPQVRSCFDDAIAGLRTRLGSVAAQLRELIGGHGGKLVITGYWNVFRDGAVGRAQGQDYVQQSDAVTRAVNTVIAAASAQAGGRYLDLYRSFKGTGGADCTSLLGPDGDHPDAAGHQVIANAVLAVL